MVVDPGPLALEELQRLVREERGRTAELARLRDLPAQTLDGIEVTLQANVGLASDIGPALDSGAGGVGLYRSEFAFMVRDSFPGEDEQVEAYRQVLEAFAPLPVTMRSLDVGSDKGLPYFPIEEENPALGWRGIRLTLDNLGVFLTQWRAMLRANTGLGNLQLLFPMISSPDEVDGACELLARARDELARGGERVDRPSVGVMIEVPGAPYQLPALSKRVDFFSFGTNDLTQYLLAVDRNNARVASRCDSLHPAVLRAIVTAGDPAAAMLLLGMGMGIHALSMASRSVPHVKQALRSFSQADARATLKQALAMETSSEVRLLLATTFQHAGLTTLSTAR